METPDTRDDRPARPAPCSWWRPLLLGIVLGALGFAIALLVIKALRRGGPAVLAAATAPVLAASARSWAPKPPPVPRQPIDREFVKARLRDFAQYLLQREKTALVTPAELCHVLNHLLQKGQRTPFASPGHMALELAKLGLKSQVQTVADRAERRWYDLTAYAHPQPAT